MWVGSIQVFKLRKELRKQLEQNLSRPRVKRSWEYVQVPTRIVVAGNHDETATGTMHHHLCSTWWLWAMIAWFDSLAGCLSLLPLLKNCWSHTMRIGPVQATGPFSEYQWLLRTAYVNRDVRVLLASGRYTDGGGDGDRLDVHVTNMGVNKAVSDYSEREQNIPLQELGADWRWAKKLFVSVSVGIAELRAHSNLRLSQESKACFGLRITFPHLSLGRACHKDLWRVPRILECRMMVCYFHCHHVLVKPW